MECVRMVLGRHELQEQLQCTSTSLWSNEHGSSKRSWSFDDGDAV